RQAGFSKRMENPQPRIRSTRTETGSGRVSEPIYLYSRRSRGRARRRIASPGISFSGWMSYDRGVSVQSARRTRAHKRLFGANLGFDTTRKTWSSKRRQSWSRSIIMTNANPVSTTSREEHPAQRDGIYKRFMISKKCPGCGSRNVRRSKRIAGEMTWKRNFLSPYRCRDCKKRFSVVSTKIHYRFWMAGLAIAAGIIFWREYPSMDYPFLRPEPPVSAGKIVADATKLAEKRDPAAEYTLSQIYAQG